jgi:uncharacterized membrane protein (DUF2068 family)
MRARGLRLIVAYKTSKGVLELVVGAVLALESRAAVELAGFARRHLSPRWGEQLVESFAAHLEPGTIHLVAAALSLDGLLGLFEGWVLHARRAWGPFVVIASTGSLIPFEIVAIAERPSFVRLGLLALNVATVAYLAWRVRRSAAAPAS